MFSSSLNVVTIAETLGRSLRGMSDTLASGPLL
jgi:hypothetical protein